MLDSDTKRRIDTARDILVGKVPDPKSQVEQITIALIYKFMDDMDAQAEELGGKRKFFARDFARYGWSKLMSPSVGGHELIGLYGEGIAKMPENPGIPTLFRDIFKNAFLPYRDPETLKAFLKIINEFEYDHSERLGDAFEYLLSVLGSQGDAGQFRTPRHIIDFVVRIVDPKKNETILDPACGTAGFLISAYKHILAASKAEGGKGLTPDERKRLAAGITGYDISPDMVRLSRANMYLHGFADPHIHEYDTLTSQDRWNETFDVILANPPFMSPKGGIKPHNLFSIQTKRSEALFLDYILSHLSPQGKAGVIVPEGIHFDGQAAYETLRQSLLNKGGLVADVTLPHGVFKPYASVKTHVLLVDRVLAAKMQSILFVEIDNDGFTQTDTRAAVPGEQLTEAAEIIHRFKCGRFDGTHGLSGTTFRAYTVTKSQLREGPSQHLLGRWHDLPNRVVHRSDITLQSLGALCDIRLGQSANMATRPGEFTLVVPAAERKSSDHWTFDAKAVCVPVVSSAGHGKAEIKRLHLEEGKFALASTMCALIPKATSGLQHRFLHLYLTAMSSDLLVPLMCGATNVTMDSDRLADVLVPVPSTEVQDEIIETHLVREKSQELLENAKCLVELSHDIRVVDVAKTIVLEAHQMLRAVSDRMDIAAMTPKRPERGLAASPAAGAGVGQLGVHVSRIHFPSDRFTLRATATAYLTSRLPMFGNKWKSEQPGAIFHEKGGVFLQIAAGHHPGSVYRKGERGPLDDDGRAEAERIAKERGWYTVTPGTPRTPELVNLGKGLSEAIDLFKSEAGERLTEVDRVIRLMAKWSVPDAERYATLYTVWNDLVCDMGYAPSPGSNHAKVSDGAIIAGFFNWHEAKRKRFTEAVVLRGIAELRQMKLIPDGVRRLVDDGRDDIPF